MDKIQVLNKKNLLWIWDIWKNYRLMLFIMFAFTVGSAIVGTLYPVIIKKVIDTLTLFAQSKDKESIILIVYSQLWNLFYLGIFGLVTNFFPAFRGLMNNVIEARIRKATYSKILNKGYDFFLKYKTGDLLTRLTDDITDFPKVSWFLCSGIFRALNGFVLAISCIGVMFWMDWLMTLLSLSWVPFLVYYYLKFEGTIKTRFEANQKFTSRLNSYLEGVFNGLPIIRAYSRETEEEKKYRELLTERKEVQMDQARIEAFFSSYFPNLAFSGQAVVVFAGAISVFKGRISLGEFYAFFSYLSFLIFLIMDISFFFVSGKQALVSISRIQELEEYPVLTESHGVEEISEVSCIELENAGMKFPNGENGLSELNIQVNKGEWIAIVGGVGSGKTSLLRMLAGTYPCGTGTYRINQQEFGNLKRSSILEKIGMVTPESVIFSVSVLENICFFREKNLEQAIECSEIAQVHGEILSLPNSYEEIIGPRGLSLSGGQRQRLSIGRAIYGKPQLLLLDDVTSSLDAENEAQLILDLRKFLPESICFFATHRLRSGMQADKILCLAEGKVAGFGTHEELKENSSVYQNLLKSLSEQEKKGS